MNTQNDPEEVELHFIKSNQFRTIHCDGVFGAKASDWSTHLILFSERAAIPKKIVLRNIDGKSEEEVIEKRESKNGLVRDVEANVVLTLDGALGLYEWLKEFLEEAAEDGMIAKVEDTTDARN